MKSKAKLLSFSLVGIGRPADAELMNLVQRGDYKAFEMIYNEHKKPLFNFILNMTSYNEALAGELLQESFTRAFDKADQFKEGSVRNWLFRIARNLTIDYFKTKDALNFTNTIEEETTSLEEMSHHNEDAEAILLDKVQAEQVRHCVEALNIRQKEATTLQMFSGLSYEEIAKTMETTEKSIKSLLSRARASLKKCLEGFMNE